MRNNNERTRITRLDCGCTIEERAWNCPEVSGTIWGVEYTLWPCEQHDDGEPLLTAPRFADFIQGEAYLKGLRYEKLQWEELTARIDDYLANTWLGEITRYCLIRSGDRFAFCWGGNTFPTEENLVPAVNVELQEEGILWSSTIEEARGAAAEAFAALEQQEEDVTGLREAFGLSD